MFMLVLVLLGLLQPTEASQTPAAASDTFLAEARGQELAQGRCAVCHSVGRDGASPDPEAPRFRDLPQLSPLTLDDPAFNARMTRGHPVMPDFELEAQELQDITAYIRSLERPDDGPFY